MIRSAVRRAPISGADNRDEAVRVINSGYSYSLFRLSVPAIPNIRTRYSEYPYPLFRISVPAIPVIRYSGYPVIRTRYSGYSYPLFRLFVP